MSIQAVRSVNPLAIHAGPCRSSSTTGNTIYRSPLDAVLVYHVMQGRVKSSESAAVTTCYQMIVFRLAKHHFLLPFPRCSRATCPRTVGRESTNLANLVSFSHMAYGIWHADPVPLLRGIHALTHPAPAPAPAELLPPPRSRHGRRPPRARPCMPPTCRVRRSACPPRQRTSESPRARHPQPCT